MLKLEEEFSYFKFFNSYKMIAYAGVFIVLVLFIFASQVKQKSRQDTLDNIDPSVFGSNTKKDIDGLKDKLNSLGDFGSMEKKMNHQLKGLEDRMSQMTSQFSGLGEIDAIRKQLDELSSIKTKPDLGE